MNTCIHYMYRDGANYKFPGTAQAGWPGQHADFAWE